MQIALGRVRSGRPSIVHALCAVALCAAVGGCARLNSIHRGESVPSDRAHILSVDAKQRAILSSPFAIDRDGDQTISDEERKNRVMRFCAEPPPDVFTAIGSTLGLKAGYGRDKARQEANAEFLQAISENAATIERTQTVNILREAMYRNCERYLSGAISENEFIVQAARDQRAMVHVLAVEQLTGAAKAQSTALTTIAKAASTGTSPEALKALEAADDKRKSARSAASKAAAEAKDQTPALDCSATAEAFAASGASESDIAAKKNKCAAAKAAAEEAERAEAHYANVADAVEKQSAMAAETTGELKTAAKNAEAASKAVADAVVEIVKQNNAFSELEMTCVVFFRNLPYTKDFANADHQAFSKACLTLIGAIADVEARGLRLKTAEDYRAQSDTLFAQIQADIASVSEAVWKTIANAQANGVDPTKFATLETKAGIKTNPVHRRRLLNAKTKDEFGLAFRRLPRMHQEAFRNAAD
jgi:hypothetical protein